jgi:hypothetical protein
LLVERVEAWRQRFEARRELTDLGIEARHLVQPLGQGRDLLFQCFVLGSQAVDSGVGCWRRRRCRFWRRCPRRRTLERGFQLTEALLDRRQVHAWPLREGGTAARSAGAQGFEVGLEGSDVLLQRVELGLERRDRLLQGLVIDAGLDLL